MREVFLALLHNPALTLTSWLTLLSSCTGDKFNDFLKVIRLMKADSGFELYSFLLPELRSMLPHCVGFQWT